MGEHSRLFLVKQGHRSAIGRLDLSGLGDVLDVLSGTSDNVALLNAIRAKVGDDPDVWLPRFHDALTARRRQTSAFQTSLSSTTTHVQGGVL